MISHKDIHICHITTVHSWDDIRIFQRMCSSLAEKGLRVTLVAPVKKETVVRGIRLIPTGLHGKLARICGVVTLLPLLWRLRGHLYHFHDPELLPWMTLLQALMPWASFVYDVHEYHAETVVTQSYFRCHQLDFMASKLFARLEPLLAKRLHGVIGVTTPIADRFRGGGARVAVIRNVVNVNAIRKGSDPTCFNHEMLENKTHLLVLGGTIDVGRCMAELVVAIGLLKQRGLQLYLLCMGDPFPTEMGDRLLALAEKSGIGGQVSFKGKIPFAQYQQHIAQSRLGMVLYGPSINNSMGVPNRLYEFMAHGIPIIASDYPEVAKVVRDAECGLLVDTSSTRLLADAMEYLLTHPVEAARMGANGRRAIEEKYNWNLEFQALLDFYGELLDKNLHEDLRSATTQLLN